MLRSKFKKLQKYLDNLILDNINSNSILAYAKLHLIKNHPEFNKEYFPNKIELRKNKKIKNFYFGLINFFKNFIIEDTNFYIKNNKTFKPKVLILSHLINLKHLNSKDDFYYGDLVNQLNNLNLDSKLILRNETKLPSKQIFEKLNKDKIILSKRTFFLSEILYLFIALTNFIKFNLKIKKYRYKKKSINFFTLKSFGYIISNLRLNSQINYLLKIYEPKFLIITFEGHGWERLIIRNVKKNKKTKVIAYQFSAITKDHHSLFRSLSKTTDPDFIFTTGTHTYKKFKKSYNCKVKIIGSHKWKKIASYNKKKTKNNVLILPEAYVSESKDLLNFAIQISKFNKEFYFYLRLHPMINIKELNIDIKKI